jgi:hypothetical protein
MMRGRILAILGVALLWAGAAQARPLNWSGTIVVTTGTLPSIPISGGGVATVNGSGGVIPAHLGTLRLAGSRGNVTGTGTNIITDPETIGNGIAAVIVEGALQTGTLAPISGVLGSMSTALTMNRLPLGGVARICLLSTVCTDFIPLVLTEHTAGSMTIGVGIGGLLAVSQAAIRISLEAAPWTVKTATAIDQTDDNTGLAAFHNVTKMGFAHGPASLTTSTAGPSGVLQIVTPNQVRTNLALGTSTKIGVLGELLVHFIPEPGLLTLLGAGVVGLALLGSRRIR